jgi:hypothetical protein
MSIHVHIERVVLEGLPIRSEDGLAVRDALQTELARRLTEGGLAHEFAAGGAIPSLRAGPLRVEPRLGAAALGRRIAHSVYGGLGR